MNVADITMLIPIVAIVMGVGAGIFRTWTRHEQEIARIRSSAPTVASGTDAVSLRDEIAKLRDTTTQYDMSVERALTEIQHRLTVLELAQRRAAAPQTAPTAAEPIQTQRLSGGSGIS